MSIVLLGSTSGSVTLQEQAVSGTTVLDLPATSGTILTTGSSGQSIPKAALPTGSVLQVTQTSYTTSTSTTSEGYVTTGLSASITPTSATSKILVLISVGQYSTADGDQSGGPFALYRGASEIAALSSNTGYIVNTTTTIMPLFFQYLDSPATTSSTTYQVYIKNVSGGTIYISQGKSSITAFEIAG